MLIQALAEYADTYLADDLAQEAWEEKPVPLLVEIDSAGSFINIVSRLITTARGKKAVDVPAPLLIPRSPVPRNAGLHPLLAADDIRYVLGPGPWTAKGQDGNNQERKEAFVALIARAAIATDDEALLAAHLFYQRDDQVEFARSALAATKAGTIVALSMDGPLVKRPAVRSYWTQHYNAVALGRQEKTGQAECMISGRVGPIAPTHEKIKGLSSLGGQASGVSLMSFDKDAFQSYNWQQNANSPVSPDRAMAYVLALNDLLRRDKNRRRDHGGVGFLFWTKRPAELDPFSFLEQADSAQVQSLLNLDPRADPDPNFFYMAGVSGNGGRMVLRYWVAATLGEVKANLHQWFAGLRIVNVFTGEIAEPPKLWQLLRAIHREGEPPEHWVIDLLQRAIEGSGKPLGQRMLGAALGRLRNSKEDPRDPSRNRIYPARAGLIRLCVNDLIHSQAQGETPMSESLDLGQGHPAYICGRLLAVYENIQYRSNGGAEVNQTVTDRYYTLASTYPAQAFPKIATLGNKHLQKLRRDKPGAKVSLEQLVQELSAAIENGSNYRFPEALDLVDQGRFALGYHHQKAHQIAAAKAYKSKPGSQSEKTDTSETTEENEQ
jgi:CRISPR-associated protein Csd1